jgi:hypothetical protein
MLVIFFIMGAIISSIVWSMYPVPGTMGSFPYRP